MASEYCTNEKKRTWFLGHDVCNGNWDKCRHAVRFGKHEYCGYCPPRCTLRDVIRVQRDCLFCKYATKKLSYPKCVECLSAQDRINYERIID